jgi:chemotaxis protein methyltransferase CheR
MNKSIQNIKLLMKEIYALDISVYDNSFLEKTLANRMNESSCKTISDYIFLLNHSTSESAILMDSLNNNYSEFFRNQLNFMMLEQNILPRILREKESGSGGEIRIWSAGCAAGQEPYSIAMLVNNYKNNCQNNVSFRIFATDKSGENIRIARKGIYHLKTIQNTRLIYVLKYFTNSDELYSIDDSIIKMVDFSVHDLLEKKSKSPPSSIYGGFDIVMCSNMLFYYKQDKQREILSKLAGSLTEGGFLFTGEAEIEIVKSCSEFRQYAAPAAIFVKN